MKHTNYKRKLKDGTLIEYYRGGFDDWCVFVTEPDESKYAPKDIDYFEKLLDFSEKYGVDKVYQDFVKIYNITTSDIDVNIDNIIDSIAIEYDADDVQEMQKLLTILYMTMVAEENKKNAILKKRIKRLGVHELLINNKDIRYCVNFMKGEDYFTIAKWCKNYGF